MFWSLKTPDNATADVEAEDVDLGNNDDGLAFDVDEEIADEDPEALDSDDAESIDEELGIDTDESESEPLLLVNLERNSLTSRSSDAYCATVLSVTQ